MDAGVLVWCPLAQLHILDLKLCSSLILHIISHGDEGLGVNDRHTPSMPLKYFRLRNLITT